MILTDTQGAMLDMVCSSAVPKGCGYESLDEFGSARVYCDVGFFQLCEGIPNMQRLVTARSMVQEGN